jgi:SagB-type dehydrogenase family enzyme
MQSRPLMRLAAAVSLSAVVLVCAAGCGPGTGQSQSAGTQRDVVLPDPVTDGGMTLNEALAARRSRREFERSGLEDEQVSQLLWAAQGITDPERGFRTAPSAGALYPLEVYVLLDGSLFRYLPGEHALRVQTRSVDPQSLSRAAEGQGFVVAAPAVFVVAADYSRTEAKYGERAEGYVRMEAGHAAQNLLLQATALGLGAVPVGAFDDRLLSEALVLPAGIEPLYLIPVGHPG